MSLSFNILFASGAILMFLAGWNFHLYLTSRTGYSLGIALAAAGAGLTQFAQSLLTVYS